MDEQEAFLTALQMGDSFFPSGAFAHSCGLETFVTEGLVSDRQTLIMFIESYLVGLVARCDLLFVKLAHVASGASDLNEINRLDHFIHAMKFSMELREASMQMGRQLLQVMSGIYQSSIVQPLLQLVEGRKLNGHHPVMFGAVCRTASIGVEKTMLTYLYSLVSSLVSAGVRLIPIGHRDGQIAINDLKPLIGCMVRKAENRGEADIASFAPAIEVRSMQHEHLHMRLFRS